MTNTTFLLITGVIIGWFDWFVYSGWQWILEHSTCTISGMTGICWGVSPFPAYAVTAISFCVTWLWAWLVFERIVDELVGRGIV